MSQQFLDLRPINEKVEQFVEDEAKELLEACTKEQRDFAEKIMDSCRKAGRPVDWRAIYELARRTLMKPTKIKGAEG